jgi:hypothetical protein
VQTPRGQFTFIADYLEDPAVTEERWNTTDSHALVFPVEDAVAIEKFISHATKPDFV